MLKMKYLFNNVDLVEMLLKNWEYDANSKELFQYYRISSNAIYPFKANEQSQFIRFAPTSEKIRENIAAELEFISYLKSNGYHVLEIMHSKDGRELIEADTPWGTYYASVFKKVVGQPLSEIELTEEVVFTYGKALGKLHQLSNSYEATDHKRWSHLDVLDWIEEILRAHPYEQKALEEKDILKDYFSRIPISENNFGLIHYDFETDNVFFDKLTETCHVIDFDDAMYHFYVMDIVQALDSLEDCVSPELFEAKKQMFLEGYSTEYTLEEDSFQLIPACERFAKLYGYVRLLRSIDEEWNNEPDWLVHLRVSFKQAMVSRSSNFGKEI